MKYSSLSAATLLIATAISISAPSLQAADNIGVGATAVKGAELILDGSRKLLDDKWTYWKGPRFSSSLPIKWKVVDDPVDSGKKAIQTDDPAAKGGRYGTADIVTKKKYRDFRLHIEFLVMKKRGNSGVYLQNRYEIQVLDNYKNQSNPKGQAGSVYKQHIPLVNACRPPGEWQTFDIIFRAPYYDKDGKRVKMGTFTDYHNGILVQDKVNIFGRTNSNKPVAPDYKQPFFLQDHGSLVSYRNIWVRELKRAPLD